MLDVVPVFILIMEDNLLRNGQILMRRWLGFVLLGCMVLGCTPRVVKDLSCGNASRITLTRTPGSFVRIEATGRINLILHTQARHARVVLQGAACDVLATQAVVRDNTLILHEIGSGIHRGNVTVHVYTQRLRGLVYRGVGVIKGKNLVSSALDLSITNAEITLLSGQLHLNHLAVKGSGQVDIRGITGSDLLVSLSGNPHVQLIGMVRLNRLHLNGNGFLNLYWIKSPRLIIRQKGHVMVQLAGVVKVLDVELWGHSTFNGRYLRATEAFVKTHEHSVAELSTVSIQHTLATGASDILFYTLPTMKADFMAYDGAVLDMRDPGLVERQLATIYNK